MKFTQKLYVDKIILPSKFVDTDPIKMEYDGCFKKKTIVTLAIGGGISLLTFAAGGVTEVCIQSWYNYIYNGGETDFNHHAFKLHYKPLMLGVLCGTIGLMCAEIVATAGFAIYSELTGN